MDSIKTLTPKNCVKEAAAFAAKNPNKTPPLHALIEDGRFDEALLLAERGLYVDQLNYYLKFRDKVSESGESALLAAIKEGAPSSLASKGVKTSAQTLVASLLDHGAPLYGDFSVYNLLASWQPEEDAALELVRFLVARCGVTGSFRGGVTLLHAAAAARLPRVIEFLLDAGADPEAEGYGATPAQLALEFHQFHGLDRVDRCLTLLSAKKGTRDWAKDNLFGKMLASQEYSDPLGDEAAATTKQVFTVFRTILARGERPVGKDAQGNLPLDSFLESMASSAATLDEKAYPTHMEAEGDQAFARDVALFLIENGGASPRMLPLAAYAHLALLLEELLSREKPAPNAVHGKTKNTLLHEALRREEFSGKMTARTIHDLLAYGVDPEAPNGKKKSALDLYATAKRTLRPAWRKTIEAALADGAKAAGGATAGAAATAKKPAAKGEGEGLLFPCAGLHLAVLGALRDKKLLKISLKKVLKGIDAEGEESGLEEDARIAVGVEALHAIPLDPSAVAKLQSLSFDGGNSIYLDVEEVLGVETGGETEVYGLTSLEGIGALVGLTKLSLDGHGYSHEAIDLSPLTGHPALTSLTLSGGYTGTEALETIGTLERVKALGDAKARERLQARGIDVS
jgi:hypothetical protein